MNIDQSSAVIKHTGLIAIIRGDFGADEILKIGEALRSGGIVVLEVTLNSRGALEAITRLRGKFGEQLLIGAGSVRTSAQVDVAAGAGAQFLVSPNFDPASVARAQALGLLLLPGVLTPTEAQNAHAAGCRLLKLFPADAVGPAYLRALRAPLNDIDFVPTGGVTLDNVVNYAQAGAVAMAIGSALVSEQSHTQEEILREARRFRIAWDQARYRKSR